MKKISLFFLTVTIIYLAYGVFLSRYQIQIIPPELEPHAPVGFYDYEGVTNVHTLRSLGSGSINEVIGAAQQVGLDFIYITDLNDFSPPKSYQNYYDQTLVFIGAELSYLDSQILLLDAPNESFPKDLVRSQIILTDYLNTVSSSLSPHSPNLVLAHPLKPGYTWNREFPPGLNGLEIINLKSIWQKNWIRSKASFIWTLLIYPFNPKLALLRLIDSSQDELNLWDQLSKKQKTFGMAGVDAESRIQLLGGSTIAFPSYEQLFQITRNHILLKSELTGDAQKDILRIQEALKMGQFYFSFDLLSDPKGFSTYIKDKESNIYSMGTSLKYQKGMGLFVRLPHQLLYPFEIVLYKDGQRNASYQKSKVHFSIDSPGVYRILVRVIPTLPLPDGKKWIPWIYSNPFYINP